MIAKYIRGFSHPTTYDKYSRSFFLQFFKQPVQKIFEKDTNYRIVTNPFVGT